MRKFTAGFAACYLIGAALLAASGFRAIPCMTPSGALYYGALWPLAPLSVALNRSLYPIPAWACEVPK